MKCRRIKKIISLYIDDELTAEEKEAFITHIGQCRYCRLLFEEIRTIHELCISAEIYSAPFDFSENVMANIKASDETSKRDFSLTRMPPFLKLAEFAFALIVLFAGIASGYILLSNDYTLERLVGGEESYSLEVFGAVPPGSLGSAYITVMGGAYHER